MNDHTICVESGRLNFFKAFATDEVIRFNDNQVTSAWLVPGTEQNLRDSPARRWHSNTGSPREASCHIEWFLATRWSALWMSAVG